MGKLTTPDWVLEGFESKAEYEKSKGISKKGSSQKSKKEGKTFSVKRCPKCKSDNIAVIIGGEEGKGCKGWECKKCHWEGKEPVAEELTEDEFMKYLDERGEELM